MFSGIGSTAIGTIGAVVVGAVVGAVTVLGLVNSQVNSAADHSANANNPTISYGSNG